MDYSFRFLNSDLNRRLIDRVKKMGAKCAVDADGTVHYGAAEAEVIEDDIIAKLRDRAFSPWKLIFCPHDWTDIYRRYMVEHDVPFIEELNDGELSFLIPRKYRPHAWKLEPPQRQSAKKRVG